MTYCCHIFRSLVFDAFAKIGRIWLLDCCDRKTRAASAQNFTSRQQATIEITRRDHSIAACSRHVRYRQWWDLNFLRTGPFTPRLTNKRFSHYQSPEAKIQLKSLQLKWCLRIWKSKQNQLAADAVCVAFVTALSFERDFSRTWF